MTNHEDSKSPLEKISNENYIADLDLSVQYTRWFLTLLGLWPHLIENPTRIAIYVSRIIMPLPTIVNIVLFIPLAAIPLYRDLTITQWILWFVPLSYRTTAILKHFILISRRNDLKSCIGHMKTDWRCIENYHHRDIMMKNVRLGRGLTVVCVVCVYSGVFLYNIQPYVLPRKLNEFNETIRPNHVQGGDIFVDLDSGYNYEMVIFVGWAEAFWTPAIVTAICNLATVLVCHACGQIQIVMSRLENLVSKDLTDDPDKFAVEREIALIIPIHVRALRFASKIDEILRELCLLEVVSATLIICLVGYCCVTERKTTGAIALASYATLLISLSFNIFIFCQIGELLEEQAVANAAYVTEWYRLPGKTGLALIMFIRIANNPRKLTAGKIIDLSIMTFGNIMRMSIGYGNMLITMAD